MVVESVGEGGFASCNGIPCGDEIVVVSFVGGAEELVNAADEGRWWGAGRVAVDASSAIRHGDGGGNLCRRQWAKALSGLIPDTNRNAAALNWNETNDRRVSVFPCSRPGS